MSTFQSPTMSYDRSGEASLRRPVSAPVSVPGLLLFFAAHVPLALLMFRMPAIAGVHAAATVLVSAAWATSGAHPSRVLSAVAYIAGSEVLWRMTHAPIPWESGKYALIVVLLLALPRTRPLRVTSFPLVYFALLVPSTVLTLTNKYFGLEYTRQIICFNLSGPLALAVCAAYCSRVRLTMAQVQRMLTSFLGPAVGMITIVLFHLAEVEKISFRTESTSLTSGNYGPNQVSSAFGFAALAAFLIAVVLPLPRSRGLKWLMVPLAIWLAAQSALTLSRSGLYLAVGSIAAAAVFGLRDARLRAGLLVTIVLFYIGGVYVVGPRLDAFTGGVLSKRFAETNLTNRDLIMKADLSIWAENPVLGVGPGMAAWHRISYFRKSAAHTEITRLLAEHGILGIIAGTVLILAARKAFRRQTKSLPWKAFVVAMFAYTLLYVMSNAMRLVIPSLAFGLAFISLKDE